MYDILEPFRIKNRTLKGINLQELKYVLSHRSSVSPGGYTYKESNKYVFIVNNNKDKIIRLDCVKKHYENMKYNKYSNCRIIQNALALPHCNSCADCHLNCIINYNNGLIK